jgi:uncharacterized protein
LDNSSAAIYAGWLRHRRFLPKGHAFKYQVFMFYVDVARISDVVSLSRCLGFSRWSLVRFCRRDFHGDPSQSLYEAVANTVQAALGKRPQGRITVLANWRLLGFNMNPLTTYYCFDASNTRVEAIVAEVNNTPWDERHAYVLACDPSSTKQQLVFDKCFQVSPFNPLEMQYRWVSTAPDEHLLIHIENWQTEGAQERKVMDATLQLQAQEFSAKNLRRVLLAFPGMTFKVIAAIYWHALRLWLKGVPFVGYRDNKSLLTEGKQP